MFFFVNVFFVNLCKCAESASIMLLQQLLGLHQVKRITKHGVISSFYEGPGMILLTPHFFKSIKKKREILSLKYVHLVLKVRQMVIFRFKLGCVHVSLEHVNNFLVYYLRKSFEFLITTKYSSVIWSILNCIIILLNAVCSLLCFV